MQYRIIIKHNKLTCWLFVSRKMVNDLKEIKIKLRNLKFLFCLCISKLNGSLQMQTIVDIYTVFFLILTCAKVPLKNINCKIYFISLSVKETITLPKILDGKFYRDVQPNQKTVGGIQATCTTCLGTISGTTKSTGNFLSHIKRRHKDILVTCQLYCRTKVQNVSSLTSNTYSDDSDNIKKEKSTKELKQEPLNIAKYTTTGILPQPQLQGQHVIATPAFLWHKSLPIAPTNSMAAAVTMQYRQLKADMQPNGYFINKH